jgi:large subunit ribosomal protein L24e
MGVMFIRNDAATFWYCSSKCRKNATKLRRDPRKLKWSRAVVRAKPVQPAQPTPKGRA